MKKVLYVGYYDILRDGKQIRNYSLAAAKKMGFVFDSIAELGYHVDIISPSFIKTRELQECYVLRFGFLHIC